MPAAVFRQRSAAAVLSVRQRVAYSLMPTNAMLTGLPLLAAAVIRPRNAASRYARL